MERIKSNLYYCVIENGYNVINTFEVEARNLREASRHTAMIKRNEKLKGRNMKDKLSITLKNESINNHTCLWHEV